MRAEKAGFSATAECNIVCAGIVTPPTPPEAEKYTITFLNYDGTQLSSDTYEKDTVVTPPVVAEKVTAGGTDYPFTGWSPAFSEKAQKDVTYTATYGITHTLFETDFEMEQIPEGATSVTPTKSSDVYGWTEFKTASSTQSYVKVENSGTDTYKQIMHVYSDGASTSSKGAPSARRDIIIPEGMEYITIEYDTKTDGAQSALKILKITGETSDITLVQIQPENNTDWASVRVEIDLEKGEFISYVDGVKNKSGSCSLSGTRTLNFNAGGLTTPSGAYFDNIKVVAGKPFDPSEVVTPPEPPQAENYTISFLDHNGNALTGAEYNLTPEKDAQITVPAGPERADEGSSSFTFKHWQLKDSDSAEYVEAGAALTATKNAEYIAVYTEKVVLFEENFENIDVETAPSNVLNVVEGKNSSGNILVKSIDERKVLCITKKEDNASAYPRVDKELTGLSSYSALEITFLVKTDAKGVRVRVPAGSNGKVVYQAKPTDWTEIRIDLDLTTGAFSSCQVANGKAEESGTQDVLINAETIKIGFETLQLTNGVVVYYDNIKIVGIKK